MERGYGRPHNRWPFSGKVTFTILAIWLTVLSSLISIKTITFTLTSTIVKPALKIIFEGRRGSNDQSDAAIDDVSLHPGNCAGISY